MGHVQSHQVHIYDGDQMFREFTADVSNRLRRLEAAGMMPESVAVREDLWPGLPGLLGYPVVRLARSSPVMWGVIA